MMGRGLKLGIVGGLGARAGADILNELVKLTPVKSEGDHREISFEQKPMVETVSVLDPQYTPIHRKFYVFDMLTRMQRNGCDAALLPCFITHTFLEELRGELGLKLISLTEAIATYVRAYHPNAKRIGVLTTPYVRNKRLFEDVVLEGCDIIYPDPVSEADMLTSIYGNNGFKAGGPSISIRSHVDIAIDSLIENGAELIVPGMTEIPIVMRDGFKEFSVPILPVNEIYARFGLTQTSHNILKPFKVGVVGGVGPAATVDFLAKLVDATGASKDQDHIKVLVEQNPQIPDRTSNLIGEGADPTLALYSTARKLMNGGADIIAIPCNTAHAYVETIQKYLDIPIINMLTETADHIRRLSPMPQRVGILATSGTIACNIYQDALNAAGLRPIVPSAADQAKVMDAIYGAKGVKAGFKEGLCSVQILEAINALLDRGADAIILGCTELPLIKLPEHISQQARLFDPTMILAKKCVAISRSTM